MLHMRTSMPSLNSKSDKPDSPAAGNAAGNTRRHLLNPPIWKPAEPGRCGTRRALLRASGQWRDIRETLRAAAMGYRTRAGSPAAADGGDNPRLPTPICGAYATGDRQYVQSNRTKP